MLECDGQRERDVRQVGVFHRSRPLMRIAVATVGWWSVIVDSYGLSGKEILSMVAWNTRRSTGRRRLLFKVVAVASSLLIGLIIMETTAWALFKYRARPSYSKRIIEMVASGKSSVDVSNRIAPHPYALYVNEPAHSQHNALGLRGPEVELTKKSGLIRILFLGGSTVYSTGVRDYHDAWCWKLCEILNEQSTSAPVEALNAGLVYATTAEHLAQYVFRYRYLNADIVVVEAGGNDQIAGWYPNYDAEYSHFRGHGRWWNPSEFDRFVLRSNIAKAIYLKRIRFFAYTPHPYPYEKLDRQAVLERVRSCRMEGFERNLDLLLKLIRMDGAEPVVCGFIQNRKEELSKNRPELVGLELALHEGHARHIAVAKRVAEANEALWVMPKQTEFTDDMFLDNCHLTAQGERKKAAECVDAMRTLIDDVSRVTAK